MEQPEFDTLVALAANDEAAFETLRAGVLDATLLAAPAERRARLERVRFRMDVERQRATDVRDAGRRANRLLLGGVVDLAARILLPIGHKRPSADLIPISQTVSLAGL